MDIPLGGNFNIVQAYFFLGLMSRMAGLKTGYISHTITNAHCYNDQWDIAEVQLSRETRGFSKLIWPDIDYSAPIDEVLANIDASMFEVEGYDPHPPLAYPFSE